MAQWILTSSLLIVAVLAVRALAGDRISPRLRYGLWALVLVRLLVPVQLGSSPVSVLNVIDTPERIEVADTPVMPQLSDTEQTLQTTQITEQTQTNETVQHTEPSAVLEQAPEAAAHNPLLLIWGLGMALTGGVLLTSNLRFAARLRRSRVPLALTDCSVTVYVSQAAETACLFGALRPSVYITQETARDESALPYVLTHELTHYRHKDHIWSLLRCLCVTVHWYNPLVWLAAFVSQQDGELACDEGALAVLGEGARVPYARTLLDMTCPGYRGLLTTATSMTGSENDLKKRIVRIVKNPKTKKAALVAVAIGAAVLVVCLFTGKQQDPLEGFWRTVTYETAPYPQWKTEVTTELLFRDGRMRVLTYNDGVYTTARDFYYTLQGDALVLEEADYRNIYRYTIQKAGDSLTFVRENGLTEGTVTRAEESTFALVPDRLMEVKRFYRNHGEKVTVFDGSMYSTIPECQLMTLLEGCTILDSYPAPQELPPCDYAYGAVLEGSRGTRQLLFADGVLYLDGMAYVLDNAADFQAFFENFEWRNVEGYLDEYGMLYSLAPQAEPGIMMTMPCGYGDTRFYMVENQEALAAAIVQLKENTIVGDCESLTKKETVILLVTNVEGLSYLNVYSNGVIWFRVSSEDGEGTDCYVRPQDVPLLAELLEPYVEIYEAEAEKAVGRIFFDGIWTLDAPVGDVSQLKLRFESHAKAIALSAFTGNVRAQIGEKAYYKEFDYYSQDGILHLRWADGSEEAVSCDYDGETLILHTESGTWRFHRTTPEAYVLRGDVLRFARTENGNQLAAYLSPSSLTALESLLREGMEPLEENMIHVKNYYYKLDGLEEAFGTADVTLSDYGTLHFNGESYQLTNWDEVEAFLDAVFVS